jgi:hypothetical protein
VVATPNTPWPGAAWGIIGAMPTKPRKPPIDKKAVLARLEHAQTEQLLVRLRRWIPDADRLEGFVVGIGAEWVALQRLSDRIAFDGWQLVRRKDIQSVTIEPDPDCFEITALRARDLWPPTAPELDLDLDDTVGAITTASRAAATMLSVHVELDRPDVCWIGAVTSVDERLLRLLEVNTHGGWARRSRTFDPADVTRLDLGGGYEEALLLVAGPPPSE